MQALRAFLRKWGRSETVPSFHSATQAGVPAPAFPHDPNPVANGCILQGRVDESRTRSPIEHKLDQSRANNIEVSEVRTLSTSVSPYSGLAILCSDVMPRNPKYLQSYSATQHHAM